MDKVVRSARTATWGSPGPRGRRLTPLLALVVLAPTVLSGCISVDFFLPQRDPGPSGPNGLNGLLRLWVAVQPGAIGAEFAHYNLTFGAAAHMQDVFGDVMIPMNNTFRPVDLVRLEREGSAAVIAGLVVKEGTYHGFQFAVLNASVATTEVIGNDGGREVVRVQEHPIEKPNRQVAEVRVAHAVIAGSVTDLYLEIDMRRSLLEDKGKYGHATAVVGVSVYINGHKAAQERGLGARQGTPDGAFDPYGTRWNDVDKYSPPKVIYQVDDLASGRHLYDSRKENRHYTGVIGLGQDLRFRDDSVSSVFERNEEGQFEAVPIIERVWAFGDGTTASGASVLHNWTSGGLYDVSLTVRDDLDLVGRTHGTFLVPYRPDEAVVTQTDARAGTIVVGSATIPFDTGAHSVSESFAFPDDLEDGDLRLGGYRVTARFADPTGGLGAAGTIMDMHVTSGFLDETLRGTSPVVLETAGIPTWRGPLMQWVDGPITVDLALVSGLYVSYELTVEALYYENMTRGFDGHPGHRHGAWPFPPDIRMVHTNGTAVRTEEA